MKLHELFPEISLNPASANDIKQWILQLAMNGKLSKDFSSQYPIQKNKISLEGYDIPNHWRIDFFKNICDFKMGKTPPSKEQIYWDGKIPWVSIADMEQNGIITETKKTLSDIGFDYSFNKIASKKGTLLMSFKLTIGKTSILGMDACHNEAIISIYPKDIISQRYLFWFLPILSNIGPQVSALMGNTLNKSKLEELVIPVPPLEEQQAIVTIIEDLFKEVDELAKQATQRIELKRSYAQAALRNLCEVDTAAEWKQLVSVFPEIFNDKQTIKTLRETILQLAVQGKLTAKWRGKSPSLSPASELLEQIKTEKAQLIKEKKIKAEKPLPKIEEDEIPFELPEGWVWTNALDISLKITDGEHATPDRTESGYKLISARNVTNEGIKLEKIDYVGESEFLRIRKRCDPQKGDILISCSGSVGRVCLVDKDDEYCMVRSAALIKQHQKLTNGTFLVYALRSTYVQEQIIEKSRSTAQSNLFLGKIKELTFPFPSLKEQEVIVEKVNALMSLCDELEREVEKREKLLGKLAIA